MKKSWFLLLPLLLTGLYYSMKAQDQSFSERRKQIVEERNKIKALFEAGQYDSAISYCLWLRKNDSVLSFDDAEKALATAYYYKGDKNTAYHYVLKQTDYNWKVYTADAFSDALLDFEYAYPIATDTFLEKVVINKVRENYLNQEFPEVSAGFKLVLLHYEFQKSRAKYKYDLAYQKDFRQRQLLTLQFEEEKSTFMKRLLDIIANHGNFYTWKEAGNGYRFQYTFAERFKDCTFHAALKPYYERSFQTGNIEPNEYVDELLLTTGIQEAETEKLNKVRDSLCKIYKCKPLERNMVHFNNGDSMVYYKESTVMYRHGETDTLFFRQKED